jgi:hypothetical protein
MVIFEAVDVDVMARRMQFWPRAACTGNQRITVDFGEEFHDMLRAVSQICA